MKRKYMAACSGMLLLCMMLVSCARITPDIRPQTEGSIPVAYSPLNQGETTYPQRWWETFDDPQLNALIEEAFSGSFTLKQAWARLRQARAVAMQSESDLYPDLTLTSGASYSRSRSENGANGKSTQTLKDFSLGVLSSYELDLWGRIHSLREADLLTASAGREDVSTAAMTLAAEVTSRWLEILSQTMQLQVLEHQLKTNITYLELIELRFRNSMATALDVFQQQQIVEKIRAQVPLVKEKQQLLRHELAVLIGRPPQADLDISRISLPEPTAVPAAGIPADLLSQRPDIRAAGFRLMSADWETAAARANRLPAISLSAQAGYSADHLDLIFDNWLLSLAGNLTAPIFDGRKRASEVKRLEAVADEKLAAYRETVYTAIKEVEDALVSEYRRKEHISALVKEITTARKALDEARQRYLKGVDDYLPVLTQLLSVQSLELDLIEQKSQLLTNRVSLYRALGGSWMDELTPERS